jgi:hypothetical protein
MRSVELKIDKVTDRHGRVLGSRLEVRNSARVLESNSCLVQAVNSLAKGNRKGKLILAVGDGADSELVRTMAGISKELRKSIVVEVNSSAEALSAVAIAQIKGLRSILKIEVAIRSDGAELAGLIRDIRNIDPQIVIIDAALSASMVRTRRREALLDLVEACAARGARVAMSGEFCDGDQAWFIDAGADMFIGHSFGVRVTCEEAAHFEASRRVIAEAGERGNLDSLMSRLGVQRAMNVE